MRYYKAWKYRLADLQRSRNQSYSKSKKLAEPGFFYNELLACTISYSRSPRNVFDKYYSPVIEFIDASKELAEPEKFFFIRLEIPQWFRDLF